MKIGIVIYSNDSETVWNAFRFGNYASKEGDAAQAFLIGKGVESESLDTDTFNVTEQMSSFVESGGTISACETCLTIHHLGGLELCPISTLGDLHVLIKESDKIVTFYNSTVLYTSRRSSSLNGGISGWCLSWCGPAAAAPYGGPCHFSLSEWRSCVANRMRVNSNTDHLSILPDEGVVECTGIIIIERGRSSRRETLRTEIGALGF